MNACLMISICADRQDPSITVEPKAVITLRKPDVVILWDASVPRVQHENVFGGVDGPSRTWAMVLK